MFIHRISPLCVLGVPVTFVLMVVFLYTHYVRALWEVGVYLSSISSDTVEGGLC